VTSEGLPIQSRPAAGGGALDPDRGRGRAGRLGTVGSGLVTFGIFGGLAALSAGVLAWELASLRVCPRCGYENSAVAACAACGYDVRERPRFACTEGHRLAFEPGMCDCGRRLLALRPVPVARHALRAVWLALGFLLVLVVALLASSLS
jgi:hypothetical protein